MPKVTNAEPAASPQLPARNRCCLSLKCLIMRVEQLSETVTLYLADCREVLGSVEADALVSDPPYGVDLNTKHASRNRGFRNGRGARATDFDRIVGDAEPFDPSPFM